MFRAVLLFLALTLGAAWPATGWLSVAASSTFSELASGDLPAIPGGVRSLAVPGAPDSGGGADGGGRPAPRRVHSAAIVEPAICTLVRKLADREAAAHATEASYLAHAARQALTRAGLVSSPRTAPPCCLV